MKHEMQYISLTARNICEPVQNKKPNMESRNELGITSSDRRGRCKKICQRSETTIRLNLPFGMNK